MSTRLVMLLASALEAIADIIALAKHRRESSGLDDAAAALTAIGAVVDAVKGGTVTEAELAKAEDDFAMVKQALTGNDAAADAAIRAKFGDTSGEQR